MLKTFPFRLTSDEIKTLDALVICGMAACSTQNPTLSTVQAAQILTASIQNHANIISDIPDGGESFFTKFKALTESRDEEERLGILDHVIAPPILPVVARMDFDQDELAMVQAMMTMSSFILRGASPLQKGVAYHSMVDWATALGSDRFNRLLVRFVNLVKETLPDVEITTT